MKKTTANTKVTTVQQRQPVPGKTTKPQKTSPKKSNTNTKT